MSDEVANVPWSADEDHPDAWKDFVELAKASGVQFMVMNHEQLVSEDVDFLVERRGMDRAKAEGMITGLYSDSGAQYAHVIELDAAEITPMVATPIQSGSRQRGLGARQRARPATSAKAPSVPSTSTDRIAAEEPW